ncbi:MAG: gliding motility-associated C-terminal domain-containing protein [Bacteroidia bacterium]|nr:gliding motility-associated C-terminal domain-containing protein [Bacteroidia bacterium]
MKTVLFILLLITSQLNAQLNPPELRCLEVLNNGQVKLTWISPQDPNNQFFAYKIYSANSATGSFSLAGTVGALATNTFVHTGDATGTSLYYYVNTQFGSGGTNTSANSDTLRTIFLNLIPGAVDLKLIYNQLTQPKLPSSSSTFTIQKEYPMGTWSLFGTSQALVYQDTISVCGDSLAYVVQLPDASGCISISNIQRGKFFDQKPPNQPYVDSISVMPNGQTVLAWRIPRDEDINLYSILQFTQGINTYIDTVPGRNSTVYTYTATTATSTNIQLYVAARDSCGNISTFDDQPTTINLVAEYDVCAYKTTLYWNAYKSMPSGVKEYWIYHAVNGIGYQKIGSTTETKFTHFNAQPGQNLCYFIRAVNNAGNITASSNRHCFFSKQVKAAAYVYIKKASVSGNHAMQLELLLDTSVASQGIELTRSEDGNNFSTLAFIPYNQTRHYSYSDTNAEVNNRAYYYKAIVRDSCGNERTLSPITRSCFLNVKQDKDLLFTQHLTWNAYQGYGGGLSGYYIYRIVNQVDNTTPIGFTDVFTTSFTDQLEDEAPEGTQIDYRVEAIEGINNPFGLREKSFSNSVPVYVEGRIFVPNAFAPEGSNKIWLPVTHFVDKNEYHVQVFDRWGHKVFETNRDDEGWDGGNNSFGIYVYLISYKNARGEYLETKGYVTLIR